MIDRGRWLALAAAALVGLAAVAVRAQEKLVFGINWVAEAEYGGFYQALAEGIYRRYGLDVTIRQGGPQVNHAQLLAAGRIDLGLADNMLVQANFAAQDIPVVSLAAFFQKAPQALLAHPGSGVRDFRDLEGRILLIATEDRLTWWPWLKARFGLENVTLRPYTFNPAPFLADRRVVMQAYVTAEPFVVRREGGFDPVVLLLADAGWNTYANILQARRETVERRPEAVQAFIDASIEGWYRYLYGDPTPAHRLIRQVNPDTTEELLAYSRAQMLAYGIVDSGDALELGIGAMTAERWRAFFDQAVELGLVAPGIAVERLYRLDFVNRGVGLALKHKLLQR